MQVRSALTILAHFLSLLAVSLLSTATAPAASIVLIRSTVHIPSEEEELRLASGFYGVTLISVTALPNASSDPLSQIPDRKQVVGIVIEAPALPFVDKEQILRSLGASRTRHIPILVFGITSNLNSAVLRRWSRNRVLGCADLSGASSPTVEFARINELTFELGGVQVSSSSLNGSYLSLSGTGTMQPVESVENEAGSHPVFARSGSIFFSCTDKMNDSNSASVTDVFLRAAPAMIFVRYCSGEHGWHALHHYANFTVDDPWLREPYGYLDYSGLLKEMQQHHFHTTIAFIPWNYDRSKADVVELFRTHPQEFSIAIHGNNHDHKEFTDYRSRPLSIQVRDIRQALARMDRFKALTGVPYDRVMIFPHSIAPSDTLAALKSYNFYATVNASNIPQNEGSNLTPLDLLRPVTLSFADFPSISRYSTELPVSPAYVAINQFLGNPLFFYDHSDFFAKGIGAFDGVADEVNRLEPQTAWCSLGTIVRHLYALRLRDDGDYDLLAYGSDLSIENTSGHAAVFYIDKAENDGASIQSVTVSGQTYPYTVSNGHVRLRVAILAGETKDISVRYFNPIHVQQTGIGHDSLRVYVLRMGSDFRDMYLARWQFGLAFISFYNDHHLEPLDLLAGALAFLVVAAFGLRLATRLARARTVRPIAIR